jgi:hypothetical protein
MVIGWYNSVISGFILLGFGGYGFCACCGLNKNRSARVFI